MLIINNGTIKRNQYTLENINLHIKKGTLNLVVGKNAAGKSSLLYAIIGSLQLQEGNIEEVKPRIAYVGNDIPFNLSLNTFQLEDMIKKIDKEFSLSLFNANLIKFGVNRNHMIKEMSTGQQKLLMFSIALSRNVDLLILDEITLNIDALSKEEMKEIFQEYLLQGDKSILISTNQLEVFENIADTIIHIKDNRIVFDGSVEELVSKYRIWQGSEDEFNKLSSVVSFVKNEFFVEALLENSNLGFEPSLKEVLIYLERT